MKIAYLISTHKLPHQFARLINRLNTPDCSFFVHIDKKSDINPFKNAINESEKLDNVTFIEKRESVHWAAYSITQSTLNLMQAAVDSGNKFDYIVLLSGQCYPIKKNKQIFEFFTQNQGKEIIEFKSKMKKDNPRLKYWWFLEIQNFYIRGAIKHFSQLILPKRKFFDDITPYMGSAWWGLTYDCVKYILDYIKQRPNFLKFYKYTWFADEMFFQTVVKNSPFSDNILDASLHFIDWKRFPPPQSSPAIINKNDLHTLTVDREHLFARKFDPVVDEDILDLIDENLLN